MPGFLFSQRLSGIPTKSSGALSLDSSSFLPSPQIPVASSVLNSERLLKLYWGSPWENGFRKAMVVLTSLIPSVWGDTPLQPDANCLKTVVSYVFCPVF